MFGFFKKRFSMAKMFYTMEETKAALNLTEEQIKQLSREGRLREFRDGPRLMFKADQVDVVKSQIATDRIFEEAIDENRGAGGTSNFDDDVPNIDLADTPIVPTSFDEVPAKGVRGCLIRECLFDGSVGKLIFRVYSEDKKTFRDYDIIHDDVWIMIDDNTAALFNGKEDADTNHLDYSSAYMHGEGRKTETISAIIAKAGDEGTLIGCSETDDINSVNLILQRVDGKFVMLPTEGPRGRKLEQSLRGRRVRVLRGTDDSLTLARVEKDEQA